MKTSYKKMREYLSSHFRYHTMNSWNNSTSFAANVKLYRLGLPKELENTAYDMLEMRQPFTAIEYGPFRDFARKHDYYYQMEWNGRSGGYIVMIRGGKEQSDKTAQCDCCGKYTWHKEEIPCTTQGCDGTLVPLTEEEKKNLFNIFTQPGNGIGEGDLMDKEEYSNSDIEDLYNAVIDFDKAVEEAKKIFIKYCTEYEVKEVEEDVPTLVKRLVKKVA
jgi:hypothetical protein